MIPEHQDYASLSVIGQWHLPRICQKSHVVSRGTCYVNSILSEEFNWLNCRTSSLNLESQIEQTDTDFLLQASVKYVALLQTTS